MATRFTETDKWVDSWFSGLSLKSKLLFLFLCDNCNLAGVIEVNKRLWEAHTALTTDEINSSMVELEKCYILSEDGESLFLKNFIKHQKNLPINKKNKAHIKILDLWNNSRHKFGNKDIYQILNYPPLMEDARGIDPPSIPPCNSNSSSSSNSNDIPQKDFPVVATLEIDILELEEVLIKDQTWAEAFCMNKSLTPERFKYWIGEFIKKLQNDGETKKNLKDAKFHFSNWYNIKKDRGDETKPAKTYKRF